MPAVTKTTTTTTITTTKYNNLFRLAIIQKSDFFPMKVNRNHYFCNKYRLNRQTILEELIHKFLE